MTGVDAVMVGLVVLGVITAVRAWWRSDVAWSLHLVAAVVCGALSVTQRSVVALVVFALLSVAYFRVAVVGLRLRRAALSHRA